MNTNWRRALLAPALAAGLLLAGCGGGGETSGTGTEAASGGIGLALAGPRNDRGFYQSAYEGGERAATAAGAKLSVVENLTDPQAQLDALTNLAADNSLVIGGSAAFADAAKTLAPQYPDVEFVVLTGEVGTAAPNLHSYIPRQGVPAYVAGAVAAQRSTTGKIGYVGGTEIPPNQASEDGFAAGARSVNPNIQVVAADVGSFSDAARAKTLTAAHIAGGADQIFTFVDGGIPGVVQAIEESGQDVGLYNAVALNCGESPAYVGTAVLANDKVVEQAVSDWKAGTLPAGDEFVALEKPDIQRFELCPTAAADPATKSAADTATAAVDANSVTLPEGV